MAEQAVQHCTMTEPEALDVRDVSVAEVGLWDEERLGTDSEYSIGRQARADCVLYSF
jgi:hypothetical protein